jgi:hypothetical protein
LFPGAGERRTALSWHNGSEFRKLKAGLARMAEEYRAAGMTEEQIAEIAAFDLEVLRSDRRFYRHTQALCPGGWEAEDAPEPGYDGTDAPLSGRLDWLEEIEDPVLLEALRELNPEMLELVTLWAIDGMGQAEIARRLGCTRQNVHTQLLRIRRFLRRRMARGRENDCAEQSAQS